MRPKLPCFAISALIVHLPQEALPSVPHTAPTITTIIRLTLDNDEK